MFERFTERARQVLVLAQDEARSLGHAYIGTEHLLLGLLREEEGMAARVLNSLNLTVDEVRSQVVRTVGKGETMTTGQLPYTQRAKLVLDFSLREALTLGHKYIGTEHLLLGLLREGEQAQGRSGQGMKILRGFTDPAEAREVLTARVTGKPDKTTTVETPSAPVKPVDLEALTEDIATAVEQGVLEGLRRALSRLNL